MLIDRRKALSGLAALPFIAMGSTRIAQSQEVDAIQKPAQAVNNHTTFFSVRRHKAANENEKSFIWLKANDNTKELKTHLIDVHGASEEQAAQIIRSIDHMTNVFNQTAREKEQVEIKLVDLKNPPEIPGNVGELTEEQLAKFFKEADIKMPSVRDYLDVPEKVVELARKDGAAQKFTILSPQGILTVHGFPVGLHPQEGIDVVKDSIAKKFFLEPREGNFVSCIYLELEEGKGVLGEGGKNGIIIPAGALPATIVTPKKMYLIGFGDDIKEEAYDPKVAVPYRTVEPKKENKPKDEVPENRRPIKLNLNPTAVT